MIKLSEELSKKINLLLLNENYDNQYFNESDLEQIKSVSLSKKDLMHLDYFKNVDSLELDAFPSVTDDDIVYIAHKLKKLKKLKIKEQNALFNLDLTMFDNIEELCLIHNDNLLNIAGLNRINRFTFYDNKDFKDIKQIVDLLLNNKHAIITLDITYYFDILRILLELNVDPMILSRFNWVESVGLRKFYNYEYTTAEIDSMIESISYIVSKNVYATDGDLEKFSVLYKWMIDNIKFVNEDDPRGENLSFVSNVNKVFTYYKGGRLSYSKAFQMLLSFAGIKSSIVYSMGAIDTIGFYNGQKIYSLLGESDYAVLRVTLDGREYYCDPTWDSLVNENGFYDMLNLFLFSKDELKVRHKYVGEGNITNTHSYHGDDAEEMLLFAQDRLKEVKDTFDDIERLKPSIDGKELNIAVLKVNYNTTKSQLNLHDSNSLEYKEILKKIDELEEKIENDEAELIRLENNRDGIVDSYTFVLLSRYINVSDDVDSDVILKYLEKKLDIKLISSYMAELLKMCIKKRTV